jgi:hypothetical protein
LFFKTFPPKGMKKERIRKVNLDSVSMNSKNSLS